MTLYLRDAGGQVAKALVCHQFDSQTFYYQFTQVQ